MWRVGILFSFLKIVNCNSNLITSSPVDDKFQLFYSNESPFVRFIVATGDINEKVLAKSNTYMLWYKRVPMSEGETIRILKPLRTNKITFDTQTWENARAHDQCLRIFFQTVEIIYQHYRYNFRQNYGNSF